MREGDRVMGDKTKPIANPLVVLREEFDDWAILFNPDTADAVGINPVGVAVWKLIDGHHNLEEIIAKIKKHFSEVPDSIIEDIKTFVKNLEERGLIGYELKSSDK